MTLLLSLALSWSPALGALPQDEPADAEGAAFFENEVRPLLAAHCVECHSGERPKGGLDLATTGALARAKTELGLAQFVEGEPAGLLLDAVAYTDPLLLMPPSGKLPDEALAVLREWVRRGAPLPAAAASSGGTEGFDLAARKASHWAWQPLLDVAPPPSRYAEFARDPLDHFLFAALESADIPPAPEVSRAVWLRRATFVLTGLPPSPDERAAFEADTSEEAYERVVDRLLASPRYAERYARHWLDLVRYAETKAHEFDYPIPNAWQYRDYVVRAFEADVPYDRFLAEHIAGDLLAGATDFGPRLDPTGRFDEAVLGTGWWWLHEEVHSPVDTRADECDRLANQIDTLTKTALGLTVACARCHDHKFDAVSTEDYYALTGVALSTAYRQVPFEARTTNDAVGRELGRAQAESDSARRAALADWVARVVAEAPDTDLWRALRERAAPRGQRSPWGWLGLSGDERSAGLDAALASADLSPAARPVIDYTDDATPWLQDGAAFGQGPRAEGTVFVGDREQRPRIVTRRAAAADPFWRGLIPADHAGRHAGEAHHVQSGKTLVTPTIELEGGYVFHLVRGRGTVLAVCNSHRMLAGPLWTESVLHFDTQGEWRLVRHGLKRLVGTAARFEYTPHDAAGDDYGLEVAAVFDRDVDRAPQQVQPGAWFARRLEETGATTADEVALELRAALLDAAQLLVTGGVPGRLLLDDERLGLLMTLDELVADIAALRAESPQAWTQLEELLGAPRAAEAPLAARVVRRSALAPAALELEGRDERVLRRGDVKSPDAVAPRRDLAALRGADVLLAASGAGSGRLELARRWTSPEQPLVSRVYVNRLWRSVFGRGLVATVDDFGATGALPSHPELLDRLARDFVADGRSTRRFLRRLVLSAAFRRSSTPPERARERDPEGQLLAALPVRRLEAEVLRDSLLWSSGELDETRFGPPVPLHLTGFMQGRGRPGSSGPLDGARRRSIYQEVRRNFAHPLLSVFDFPTPSATRGARSVSNVPAQSLALANDPFVLERAAAFAERAARVSDAPAVQAAFMLELALGRAPTPEEVALCAEHLAAGGATALVDLAQALFQMQEFLWIP